MKKVLSILLRIVISALLLFFLFRKVDAQSMFDIVKNANKLLLVTAFLIYFLNYALCIKRWEMLIKAVNIHLPLKRIITSFSGGIFFSLFLPSTIGGDVVRSLDLAAHTKKPKEIIATVFLDRLSGYIGLVLLTLLALVFGLKIIDDKSVFLSLEIIIGILVLALIVLFNPYAYKKINKLLKSLGANKILGMITELHEEIHIFRNKRKVIVKNICISFLIQLITPLTYYLISLALGLKINLLYFFVFLPIIGAITLLPISIGGLGLRDATTVFFFAKVGVVKHMAFAMSLINFSFILFYGAIGGLIYVLTVRHRRVQHHLPSGIHK